MRNKGEKVLIPYYSYLWTFSAVLSHSSAQFSVFVQRVFRRRIMMVEYIKIYLVPVAEDLFQCGRPHPRPPICSLQFTANRWAPATRTVFSPNSRLRPHRHPPKGNMRRTSPSAPRRSQDTRPNTPPPLTTAQLRRSSSDVSSRPHRFLAKLKNAGASSSSSFSAHNPSLSPNHPALASQAPSPSSTTATSSNASKVSTSPKTSTLQVMTSCRVMTSQFDHLFFLTEPPRDAQRWNITCTGRAGP